jgi:ABC-type protease/lipase transport system fused ATPase/permease subunit
MVIRDGRIALYGPRDEVLAKITPQAPQPQPQPRVASITPRAQV